MIFKIWENSVLVIHIRIGMPKFQSVNFLNIAKIKTESIWIYWGKWTGVNDSRSGEYCENAPAMSELK